MQEKLPTERNMSRPRGTVGKEILKALNDLEDGNNSASCNDIESLESVNLEDGSNSGSCATSGSFEWTNLKCKAQSKPSWIQNFRQYFSEYCLTSGVHGVRYLGEGGRFLVEKIIWGVVIVTMCYFCITLTLSAYNKWITSPVIVTFAATETPVWKIPFPAVTICPVVKSDPRIFNYTDVYLKLLLKRNLTAEEFRFFGSISLVCEDTDMNVDVEDRKFIKHWRSINDSAVYDLNAVFPKTEFTQFWCENFDYDAKLLSKIYTSEGICYSFNMLDFDEILFDNVEYLGTRSVEGTKSQKWSIEGGYSSDEFDVFPRRTFLTGIRGGFQVIIDTNMSHLDYICSELQGFKVTLHHPSEFPDMDQHFRVPLEQDISVGIKPRMITVSEELKFYKPKDRECFFPNERPLTLFRSYSQRNCLDECLINFTLTECGCVAFYMPRFHGTPICGPGSWNCLKRCNVNYLSSQTETNATRKRNNEECNCLPSCTSLAYDQEISLSVWNFRKVIDAFDRILEQPHSLGLQMDGMYSSRLSVYFREMQFLSSDRHENYGSVEFFSSAGGLLGLFIGFSVTSAVEILYFLTLRIACNMKKCGRAFWAGKEHLKKNEN